MNTTRPRHNRLVRSILLAFLLTCMLVPGASAVTETEVTVIHFSDYHSHALPFYSEGNQNQAGLARAIGYLKQAKATQPNPILVSGGDMMNLGTPAFSDKWGCAEWPLFNGLLDGMAVGNHELDYGWDAFLGCKAAVSYPVISANLMGPDEQPVLLANGAPYIVKQVGDLKIGLFAVAGPDYPRLVNAKNLGAGVHFGNPVETAQKMVTALRDDEQVNAVILIGHQETDADIALAKQVPGIDLILGTHSHFKSELIKIDGTDTYFISPYQYLTYISQVKLSFADGKLAAVSGRLVKMDETIQPDPATQAQVNSWQAELEADPKYAPRFVKIGTAGVELSDRGVNRSESVLGNFVMDTLRGKAGAHAGFSTASSFRASIPPGDIRMEDYLTALPYRNLVMVYDLPGSEVQALLDYSVSKVGTDNFSATSGLRYAIQGGKATGVQILNDPANPSAGYAPLDPAKTYQIMTTDYQGKIAAGYKDIFARAGATTDTGLVINDTIIDVIKTNSPVSAALDGRVVGSGAASAPAAGAAVAAPAGAPPATLPTTGVLSPAPFLTLGALSLLLAGRRLRKAA
jgi:5'-nucleotidase / UDP-sugar diphosphatase